MLLPRLPQRSPGELSHIMSFLLRMGLVSPSAVFQRHQALSFLLSNPEGHQSGQTPGRPPEGGWCRVVCLCPAAVNGLRGE